MTTKTFLKGGLASLLSLIPPKKSLRRKTLLSVGLFFTLTMLFTAAWVDRYFRQETIEQIALWQSSVLGAVVKNTDERFAQSQRTIVALAEELSAHAESFLPPEEARLILKRHAELSEIFDNGVVWISNEGKLLAEYPYLPNREDLDQSQKDFFRLCHEEQKAFMSTPYVCKSSGHPVVMISAPIFNQSGKKIGVVGGSLRLTNPEIFFQSQNERSAKHGSSGYFYIMDAERTMLYHPDASRILQRDVPPGVNKLLDAALIEGFEGSGETINSRGVRQFASFSHLQSTGWVVAVVNPIEDVFAPISRFRWLYGVFIVMVLGCGLFLTHFVTRNITSNLEGIVTQLHRFPELPRHERRLHSSAADESAPIATAVNEILEEIEIEQEKIIAAKRVAEEANAAKSRFLTNLSHELRTPLHGIIGLTQLCMENEQNRQKREYLDGILSSGRTLLELLNDLLDTAKNEAGHMTLECCNFSLSHLVKDIARVHRTLAEKKDLSLSMTLDPKIPERLRGDPKRLRQVLNNLLNNAIKFSPKGMVTLTSILLERRGDVFIVCFSVHDEGIGIPAHKLDEIFDPFIQAEGDTTRRFGGTGLGLTLCRQMVTLMGGDITVTSDIGQGSTFNFCIPLCLPSGEREPQAPTVWEPAPVVVESGAVAACQDETLLREESLIAPTGIKPGKTVLIVEDIAINRMIAQKILEGDGYRVLCACDGVEAIDVWQHEEVDAILMDIQMPKMDGLQATRMIRQQESQEGRRTPIVALTAGSSITEVDACLEAGMDDALVKPYDIDTLRSLLVKIFQQIDGAQAVTTDKEETKK